MSEPSPATTDDVSPATSLGLRGSFHQMPGMLAAAGSQLCLSGNYPPWKGAAFLACGSTPYLGAAPIWNLALMGVQTPLEWVAMSPPPGDPDPGIEPTSLMLLALSGRFLTSSATWETQDRKKMTLT